MARTNTETARPEGGLLRVLTARQLRQLQRAPDGRSKKGRRDKAILACLSHGLRVGEVARLKVEHVLPDGEKLRLRFPGGKTGRVRTVTLTPTATRVLHRWLDDAHPRLYVFAQRRQEHVSLRPSASRPSVLITATATSRSRLESWAR